MADEKHMQFYEWLVKRTRREENWSGFDGDDEYCTEEEKHSWGIVGTQHAYTIDDRFPLQKPRVWKRVGILSPSYALKNWSANDVRLTVINANERLF